MRTKTWKRGVRFIAVAIVAFGFLLAMPAPVGANAPLQHWDDGNGNHWLIACVAEDDVERFTRAGFEFGNAGAPIVWLCATGFTPMAKALGH